MLTSIQASLNSGELSPSLFGRVDLDKYKKGCSTMRNMFVSYRGGASSRAGFAYVGKCKQSASAAPPRDIPFQFSINQQYVLEFGDQYLRIKYRGAYVLESYKIVTGVDSSGLFTVPFHGYTVGDWIYDLLNPGFTGQTWIVATVPAGNTFTVTDLFGNPVTSATVSGAGVVGRVYTVVSPYAAVDLPFLKYTQSADTMTLCCVNQETLFEYPPYELVRLDNADWEFSLVTFGAKISAPTGLIAIAQSSTTLDTRYSYVVTAVDKDTGNESVASPVVRVLNNNISINAGSNILYWNPVVNAGYYKIYTSTPSYTTVTYPTDVPAGASYGYIGYSFGPNFTDSNIIADLSSTPPLHINPFAPGAITAVTMTGCTGTFKPLFIGYEVNTSTGSGFRGYPVIVSGTPTAFIVEKGGRNYADTDTITIGKKANGTYTFNSGNPSDSETIIINGVTWTFKATNPSGNQTKIETVLQDTLVTLVRDLNASADTSLSSASYSLEGDVMRIIYRAIGTGGTAFTLAAGTYGGTVSGATLTGGVTGQATAVLTIGPHTGTYPAVVNYFQQRRVYGYTLNQPNTYWMSQPGSYSNMDAAIPTVDSDAIVGAPWTQQVNGIQFFQPMPSGLITLTGNGAWLLTGGNSTAITPADQTAATQAYNGAHFHIPPIVSNYDILYVQAKGSIVRDLSFNFFTNVYTGNDTTILSNHLFNFHQLQQWCYAEEPFKIIWAVRDDGVLLSLTWLKEQEIYGWARHDTNGIIVGVCSVTEPPVDAVYVLVKRYIEGENQWAYYSERMDNRNWITVEDCFCVDSGLTYPQTFPNAILTPAAAKGTSNITIAHIVSGGSGYTAPVVTAIDDIGAGSGATFSVTVGGGVITAVSVVTSGSGYTPGSTRLVVSDATGSGAILTPVITNRVTFTTNTSVFTSDNVGDVIRIGNNNATGVVGFKIATTGGGQAIITDYISGTEVLADITQTITNVIPDSPTDRPAPVSADYWSISTPVSVVHGLNHLEGMEVAILADGSVQENQTVTDGAITLQIPASQITIGLPYTCQVQSMYGDYRDEEGGTVQSKRKNIQAVSVRVEASRGFQVGVNQPDSSTQPNQATVPWTNMAEVKQRNGTIVPGQPIDLQTGDFYISVNSQFDTPGQAAVQQTYPLPLNLLSFVSYIEAGDFTD